jgi:hypothetical protein
MSVYILAASRRILENMSVQWDMWGIIWKAYFEFTETRNLQKSFDKEKNVYGH